ncbi:tetratricopeptide repeat protein [Amycolatopsis sp. NPDC059657]|uniref:tetratricopeptide repeat protein n=1 Tax=Amycolatopsis sp. NPDC059657 TaxID=3346899 RepID=UPI00366C1E34
MDYDPKEFEAAVKRLLEQRGLSLIELAHRLSLSPSHTRKLVDGRRKINMVHVRKMDVVLETGGYLERLATGQDPEFVFPRPMQLPPAVAGFVGRDSEIALLNQAFAAPTTTGEARMIVLEGRPGVGKTSLAVYWAATIIDRFPGGCLFADLRGFDSDEPAEPSDVLNEFLRSVGKSDSRSTLNLDAQTALLRSQLAKKPALIVLDNAANAEQVLPLLPGAGSVTIITSRVHLGSLDVRYGSDPIHVKPLLADEAMKLLEQAAGPDRLTAEPDQAETLLQACDRLPLAIRIAAEHLKSHPHLKLVSMVRDLEHHGLDMLDSDDRKVDIRAVFDLSYHALQPAEARMFRLLGVFPRTAIDVPAAAALANVDLMAARRSLGILVAGNLAETTTGDRVRLHQLIHLHAADHAADLPVKAREQALDRVVRWYGATALNAGNTLAPGWIGPAITVDTSDIMPQEFDDYDEAVSWYEREGETVLTLARGEQGPLAWILPCAMMPYWYLTKNVNAWLTGASTGLAAAKETRDDLGVARSLHSLGAAKHHLELDGEALTYFQEAMRLQERLQDTHGYGYAAFGLGTAYTGLNRHAEADRMYRLAAEAFAKVDCELGIAILHHQLSTVHSDLEQFEDAAHTGHKALEIALSLHCLPLEGWAHHQLGVLYQHQNHDKAALLELDIALPIRRASHEPWGVAETQISRTETLLRLGQRHDAQVALDEATSILETLADTRVPGARVKLAELATRM